MLQHTALEPHIKELGKICLDFTTNIEKKKESSHKLITENRTPRSLRLKCELTTSPSYENNRDFIILKRELNEAVEDFTKKGLNIMKRWSHINIRLLKEDRCFNVLKKAINIMDALFTYWTDVFLPLSWPNQVTNNPILFLSKIYFETDYIDNIDQIRNYFDLPTSEILLSISKILTKNNGDKYNLELVDSMDLTFLDNLEENNLIIINETLTTFDTILRATTILLWDTNQKKIRLAEAAQKLNAKLEAERNTSATVATSLAINKARANMAQNNTTNDATQLRIAILEKQLLQQSQTSKEILNQLKNRKRSDRSQIQKNKKPRLQWDTNISQTLQYNQLIPPTQMFSHSPTLNPFLNTTSQTPLIGNTLNAASRLNPNASQIQIPPNPFMATPYNPPKRHPNTQSRGGRYRGGKRGFKRRT